VADGLAAPEARYEQRESVELAFIAALQHLPGRQRAVLILREVLGFSAREVADSLDTTTASVNSAMQRARKAVDERLPEHSQQATLRSLGDARIAGVVNDYMDALDRGDIEKVLAMLTEDATWSMPPFPGLVPRARGDRRVPRPRADDRPLAPPPDARQRPAGGLAATSGRRRRGSTRRASSTSSPSTGGGSPRSRASSRRRSSPASACRRSCPNAGRRRPGRAARSAPDCRRRAWRAAARRAP
jgi:hypothetical protein